MGASAYELSILLSLKDQASKGLDDFIKKLERLGKTGEEFAKNWGVVGESFNKPARSDTLDKIKKMRDAGREIGDAWRHAREGLEPYVDEAKKFAAAQMQFQVLNLGPEANAKAMAAVKQTVKDIQGITLTDAMHGVTDLHTAVGDLDHALQNLPLAMKFKANMRLLYGEENGERIDRQVLNSFKFMEQVGVMGQGEGRIKQYFDALSKIQAAGRVNGDELRNFSTRALIAVSGLNERGLFNMTRPINELKGFVAGTGLSSLYQNMVGGTGLQRYAANWDKLGLLDHNKVDVAGGKYKNIQPGAVTISGLLQEDPFQFTEALRDALAKHGTNVDSTNEVNKALSGLFSKDTTRKLVSLLINQRDLVKKDADIAAHSMGVDEVDKAAQDADLKKIQNYEAAMKNFKTEVGMPLLAFASNAVSRLTPFMDFIGQHPKIAEWAASIVIAGKASNFFLDSFSAFQTIGKGGVELFSLLRSSLPDTAHQMALLRSRTDGLGQALSSATGKAGGLYDSLRSMPKSLQVTMTLATIGFTLAELNELLAEIDTYRKADKGQTDASAQASDSWRQYKKTLAEQGKSVSPEEVKAKAHAEILSLDTERTLREALGGSAGTYWKRALGISPQGFFGPFAPNLYPFYKPEARSGFAVAEQVDLLQKRAPGLQHPEVMAAARQEVGGWGNAEATRRFEMLLENAFPASFAESTRLLSANTANAAQSMQALGADLQPTVNNLTQLGQIAGQLPDPLSKTQQGFNQLPDPLGKTQQSFSQLPPPVDQARQAFAGLGPAATGATAGLEALGIKLSGWQPPTPQVQTVTVGVPGAGSAPSASQFFVPSKATGGHVFADGLAYIHANEKIVPAKVAARWREEDGPPTLPPLLFGQRGEGGARSAPPSVTVNYNPTINIAGEADKDKFRDELTKHARHIETLMCRAIRNGRERA